LKYPGFQLKRKKKMRAPEFGVTLHAGSRGKKKKTEKVPTYNKAPEGKV